MTVSRICLILLLLASPARAQVPRVVADIAPVHGLVAMVMQGVGAPELLLRPGASPHGGALRPSQARALQRADLVVWVGPELTPWLRRPLANLAAGAGRLELLGQDASIRLEVRGAGGDDHRDGHGEAHGEAHGALDPHAWLDPENGRIWLGLIGDRLAGMDPSNAGRYRSNARAGQAELVRLEGQIAALLAPMQDRRFVTLHDAYQYFEARFGLVSQGAVRLGDAADPGPARLARMQERLAGLDVDCAFGEPQFDPAILGVVVGENVTILELDPMGRGIEPGPEFYGMLLLAMGRAIAKCAGR